MKANEYAEAVNELGRIQLLAVGLASQLMFDKRLTEAERGEAQVLLDNLEVCQSWQIKRISALLQMGAAHVTR